MPELGSKAESQPILMGREGLVQRSWQNAGFSTFVTKRSSLR